MKIVIDEKTCLKHKMSVQEVLFALAIRYSKSPQGELLNMQNREILIKDKGVYKVNPQWSDILDKILSNTTDTEASDEELLKLAQQMRELYPKGKIKNKYGQDTPYYYRCNNNEVVKKLKKFFTIYGRISDEDILDATRRYVASFQGNYSGMRLIKYFILKDDIKPSEDGTGHVEQISDLASFLENKTEEDEDDEWDGDWTIKLI